MQFDLRAQSDRQPDLCFPRLILTVDIQRHAGLQRMTLGHGTIADDALVLGTIVRPPGQYLQRRVRVVVL